MCNNFWLYRIAKYFSEFTKDDSGDKPEKNHLKVDSHVAQDILKIIKGYSPWKISNFIEHSRIFANIVRIFLNSGKYWKLS